MLPFDFAEANITFKKPQGMTDEECGDLRVCKTNYQDGTPVLFSYWMPSKEDIEAINNGKGIFLGVLSESLPPVVLQTESPFRL